MYLLLHFYRTHASLPKLSKWPLTSYIPLLVSLLLFIWMKFYYEDCYKMLTTTYLVLTALGFGILLEKSSIPSVGNLFKFFILFYWVDYASKTLPPKKCQKINALCKTYFLLGGYTFAQLDHLVRVLISSSIAVLYAKCHIRKLQRDLIVTGHMTLQDKQFLQLGQA